jgi:hypothetical protein
LFALCIEDLDGYVAPRKPSYTDLMEQMMEKGINVKDANGKIAVASDKISGEIAPLPGVSVGQGTKYYPTLHVALLLMIIMIGIGNYEMISARKRQKGNG